MSTSEEISESPENSPSARPDSKTETGPTIPDWSDFEAFQSFLNDNSSPFMRFSSQVSRSSTISSGSNSIQRMSALSIKPSRPTSLFVANQTTVSTHVFERPLPSKSVRKIKIRFSKCFQSQRLFLSMKGKIDGVFLLPLSFNQLLSSPWSKSGLI